MEPRGLNGDEVAEIENILGYSFADKSLLERCFTLSSASAESNNERLEFLGDALIEAFVSGFLYRETSDSEGEMTRRRQEIVSNGELKKTTERLGLQRYLLYVGTECNVGIKPIGSLFEAVTAGIYLDGGFAAAKKFVTENLLIGRENGDENYKGALQEYLQKEKLPLAKYVLGKKSGEDHCPTFTVTVRSVAGSATANGASVKAAEQAAAKALLEKIRQN